MWNRADDTGGGPWTPTFLSNKKKKGRQREKRKGFKAETTKSLSPRSKYDCFNHSRASRIRQFFLPTMLADNTFQCSIPPPPRPPHPTLESISPALWNRTLREKYNFYFIGVFASIEKFSFWEKDWALGYNSLKFRDFCDIS